MTIIVNNGVWGFSDIVDDGGGWAVSAMAFPGFGGVEAYYPPLANGAYPIPTALIRCRSLTPINNDPNTYLFPIAIDDTEPTLGALSSPQMNELRRQLQDRMLGYSYTEKGVSKSKQNFSVLGLPPSKTLRSLVIDVYEHLGHSDIRTLSAKKNG